jgi:two-component system sensor histidine kinase AlgZ
MIGKLAHMLRSTLDAPDLHQIPFADELNVTEEYLDIERVRFGDRLNVQWDMDAGIRSALVPRLLLQPLVENAVRHGIARRPEGGWIRISARRAGSSLAIHIENELPLEEQSVLLDHPVRPGGLGLENVRLRLKETYGSSGSLHAGTNQKGNYEVSLILPIVEEDEVEEQDGGVKAYAD